MRVLVSAASRHGSTAEIAARIADALRASLPADAVVDLIAPGEVRQLADYDAAVLGSAVYMGHWLEPARDLAYHAETIPTLPVWLFSSGPIGDPPKPHEDPVDVADIVAATKARDHRIFAGRLERHRLGFAEKAMVIALRAPDGDFRDWAAIDAWCASIAAGLIEPAD